MNKLNVVFPMGSSQVITSSSSNYPLPLHEIDGKTLIERVIDNFDELGSEITYHFVINQDLVDKFKIDKTLNLLTESSHIYVLSSPTKGALCSSLMAIDNINYDDQLIIANHDQLFKNHELKKIYEIFLNSNATAGCPILSSVHPRWSYVKRKNNQIIETSEKNPISKNAIGGLYFFRNTEIFVNSAFETLIKSDTHDNSYYLSSVLNQVILKRKKVLSIDMDDSNYYSFFTKERIHNFNAKNFYN